MSKLLINEPPLQVLPTLAKEIGLNEAIFLQQLHYWLTPSAKYRPHYREFNGTVRPWIYNTYHAKNDDNETGWQSNFPFWSVRTIKRIVSSLKTKGLIIVSDKFNEASSNRTLWYTIDYDNLAKVEASTSGTLDSDKLALSDSDKLALSRGGQVGTLMTETTTETTTDILPKHKKLDLNTLAPFIAKDPINTANSMDDLKAITLFGYEVAQFAELDISTIDVAELKAIAALTVKLYAKPNIDKKWTAYKKWWYTDYWLGRDKNQSPTIKQVGTTWGQFEAAKIGPVANGSGPILTEAQKARLAELSAK
jgi:hypothetical protein